MTAPGNAGVSQPEAIQLFTRPGCGISASLARRLDGLGFPLEFHDIWSDASAAAFVRSVARGNETVPTLVVGSTVLVAPSVRQVITVATEEAPHLLPAPQAPPPPSALARGCGCGCGCGWAGTTLDRERERSGRRELAQCGKDRGRLHPLPVIGVDVPCPHDALLVDDERRGNGEIP
jgi:mycoredoxin